MAKTLRPITDSSMRLLYCMVRTLWPTQPQLSPSCWKTSEKLLLSLDHRSVCVCVCVCVCVYMHAYYLSYCRFRSLKLEMMVETISLVHSSWLGSMSFLKYVHGYGLFLTFSNMLATFSYYINVWRVRLAISTR